MLKDLIQTVDWFTIFVLAVNSGSCLETMAEVPVTLSRSRSCEITKTLSLET